MIKKYMIIALLLATLVSSSLSLGQTANNTSAAAGNTTALDVNSSALNETGPGNESSTAQETPLGAAENESSQETAGSDIGANLNYIWSITGIESGQVIMALSQDGTDLFGQAKYEPDSGQAWNAEVVGSVSGDRVELTLTAQKEGEMVTTRMKGVFANESISGNFSQVKGGKVVARGPFNAIWVDPDTSSYMPATVEQPKTQAPATEPSAEAIEKSASGTTSNATAQKSRFVDIHEYVDKIGPGGDLSGVPPGMG